MKRTNIGSYKLLAISCWLVAMGLGSCGSSQKTTTTKVVTPLRSDSARIVSINEMHKADSIENAKTLPPPPDTTPKVAYENYRATATMVSQLIHTELHVSFDWDKQYMYGKATITLKPYFYASDSLSLDAKGMDIKEVSLVKGKNKTPLKYSYDNKQLHILLDKVYTSKEQYVVFIDYTSKPNELKEEQGGSAAISSHKGLFFINPDGKDKTKPRQIWTQGETEDASCWFPTIDKPNQRQTEEIYITTENENKTLSNGKLEKPVQNKDNTHTDHWVMDKPIPPYLVMMAIGPFSIIHDKWRGKDVDYYIDAKYAPYAKDIFGKTPQMIEFFSNVLHFPYPWNKYDQVIVHDYVSGAMENTTATLHGDFLNKTRRELIDDPLSTSEDIISHELFHHWFGDLVTCESWSNLTLNESFADYAEYLWRQHEYGQDCADQYLRSSVGDYMNGGASHDLVNFYYNDREDVFDAVSYNKGGGILHMLRSVVGDTAFFWSLHDYLDANKFTAAEVPQLRLAFEKRTGLDLNWFFNEWYYNKGYPILSINHSYDAASRKLTVTIEQTQDLTNNALFYMPMQIDVYCNGNKESHSVLMNKSKNKYVFDVASAPDLVVADGKKMMAVCVKNENMSVQEREYQYAHRPLYLDRYEALTDLANHMDDAGAKATMTTALHDRFWMLRRFAVSKLKGDSTAELKNILMDLAAHDSSSNVRAEAISALSAKYKDPRLMTIYRAAINDSSYKVETDALSAIAKTNSKEAMGIAKKLESAREEDLSVGIATLYLKYGNDSCNNFFVNFAEYASGYTQITFVAQYGKFLQQSGDTCVVRGIAVLQNIMKNGDNRYSKYYAKSALENLLSTYQDRKGSLESKVNDEKDPQKQNELKAKLASASDIINKLNSALGQ